MARTIEEEVKRNFEAFQEKLPELVASNPGKYALMRDGEVVEFFDTARDAHSAGKKLFPDVLFSVQQVITTSADLGFFSHAVPQR